MTNENIDAKEAELSAAEVQRSIEAEAKALTLQRMTLMEHAAKMDRFVSLGANSFLVFDEDGYYWLGALSHFDPSVPLAVDMVDIKMNEIRENVNNRPEYKKLNYPVIVHFDEHNGQIVPLASINEALAKHGSKYRINLETV